MTLIPGPSPSTTQWKHEQLKKLALCRRSCECKGYRAIGDFHRGLYECEHVSPYTKGAGNVDSPVFIMLQDWMSEDYISREFNPAIHSIGRDATLDANRNLERFLSDHFRLILADVYATNLFPFVKPGAMGTRIRRKALRWAAHCFAVPQIDIVQPRLVIALGREVYNALAYDMNGAKALKMDEAIRTPLTYKRTRIWCQGHTGARGQANCKKSGRKPADEDWNEMSKWYKS